MPIEAPNVRQVMEIADDFGLELTPDDAKPFVGLLASLNASYDLLDALVEPRLEVRYPRTPGREPATEANPYNAWAVKTDIKGTPVGALAGKKVAVKDNVCIAGVPMRNGSRVLEGYVP